MLDHVSGIRPFQGTFHGGQCDHPPPPPPPWCLQSSQQTHQCMLKRRLFEQEVEGPQCGVDFPVVRKLQGSEPRKAAPENLLPNSGLPVGC